MRIGARELTFAFGRCSGLKQRIKAGGRLIKCEIFSRFGICSKIGLAGGVVLILVGYKRLGF